MNTNDKTTTAANAFNQAAELYQEKFMNVASYHATFDLFCNHLTLQNPNILEVACGPGNITKHLLTQRPDFNILGTDLAPNMLSLARKNNPTATFELLDVRAIASLGKQFNGLVNGFGLPYISKEDAIRFIADAATVLHPDGLLYLSTMEDDYSKSGLKQGSAKHIPPIFMHYHEGAYLTEALKANCFQIIELQRIVTEMTTGEKVTDLVIIAQFKRELNHTNA